MSKYKKIDIANIKTIKFNKRETKSELSEFASPFDPDDNFGSFLNSLPKHLKAEDLLELASDIAGAVKEKRMTIWMMGAHPLKVGLSPIIIDLIESGFVGHLAVSGAFIIHDTELAFFGRTSEDVSEGIKDGSFGMVEETPNLIFEAVAKARSEKLGLGEGMGKFIVDNKSEFENYSVISACYRNDIPVSVHVAIGTDTISQHPGFDGSSFGELSHNDFLLLSESVSKLAGGAVINFGSAVILPEVFLKALTVARNLRGAIEDFSTANFDMIQHYRPNTNVVKRPLSGKGKGFSFTGHHELMLPLLAAAIKYNYKELSKGK
ncbi:MAG: hypothetical protein V3W18_03460 [candidate division Zixibacteria bacterium]